MELTITRATGDDLSIKVRSAETIMIDDRGAAGGFPPHPPALLSGHLR